MKPFSLLALCICTLALGLALVLLAMVLLNVMPQGLVVLIFAALGLVIVKLFIGILSRGLAVNPLSVKNTSYAGINPERG